MGFEISALVFFGYNIDGIHNNKVFSRCISNLILVINEDVAKSLQLDENLSLHIPIYGLFLRHNKNWKCCTVKPVYNDHPWNWKTWPLFRGLSEKDQW